MPGKYSEPEGQILFAKDGEEIAGVVAMRPLGDAGAAEMVPESELDTDIMSGKISTLIHNENALNEMAVKSKRLGKPDAAKVIVNKILEQVRA